MSERTYAPAGYKVDGIGNITGYIGGIPHTYILDTFIDLTIINPNERRIYNPSESIIEADSFVFPSGYTFLTTRGLYPTATEVYNSPHCPDAELMDERDIIVPTDLDTSIYRIKGGRLIIQPCVYIYDAKFVLEDGGILQYDPARTFGNFTIQVDSGTVVYDTTGIAYCNNCGCIQEYYGGTVININSNETWTSDRTIGGLVHVNNGATLTIQDATVKFADSKRLGHPIGIRVHRGGKLVLEDATLTVLDCDKMWDGVEVWGRTTSLQVASQQGQLEMTRSLIEHAQTGITVGEIVHCPDSARGGGIIMADSSTFRNCHRAIVFDPYKGHLATNKSNSIIQNSLFVSDAKLRDHHAYPHTGTTRFVQLGRINGVVLKGNTFEDTNPNITNDTLRATGILAHDATFTVAAGQGISRFYNLYKGIDVYRSGRHYQRNIIQYAQFDSVVHGITMRHGGLDHIAWNEFKHIRPIVTLEPIQPSGYQIVESQSKPGWGIYLMDVVYPTVAENTFARAPRDQDENLNMTAYGAIGNMLRLGEFAFNTFSGLDYATQTEYDNVLLRIGCNAYSQNRVAWSINPHWDVDGHSGIGLDRFRDQGEGCLPLEKTAGNTFGINQCSGLLIDSVLQSPNVTFSYYGHGFHGSTTVPDTNCSTPHLDIEACERPGIPSDWCPEILDPISDTFKFPTYTPEQLANLINSLDSLHEKHFALATTLGYLMDLREIGKGIAMLERINFTDTRRLRAWYHLSDGDENAAESIADGLFAEDSTAHKEFRKFVLFSKDYTAQELPCETPTIQVTWLRTIDNTDNEMAFAAEATLTAIYDKQLTPTPLRWIGSSDSKHQERIEEAANKMEMPWLYPVPAFDYVHVLNQRETGVFMLFDTQGRQVISAPVENGTTTVSISHLPAGYYVAQLYSLDHSLQRAPLIVVK